MKSSARSTQLELPASGLTALKGLASRCQACPLWRGATQAVFGEGPAKAPLMLVGEQPGDQEDTAGKPFVGPAGGVLDRALESAGIARDKAYVTNAVKHFKNTQRGKRRLHQRPNQGEIDQCRWWLSEELRLVAPKTVVALGAVAAYGLLQKKVTISRVRGQVMALPEGAELIVTIHPSYVLRIPDSPGRAQAFESLVADLSLAQAQLEKTRGD